MNLLNKIYKEIKELLFKFKKNRNIKLIEEKYNFEEIDFDSENMHEDYPSKDYFLMYKNIKKGIISIDNLMLDDLIKIMAIANEEISILDRKIKEDETELSQLNIDLESLICENNSLKNCS